MPHEVHSEFRIQCFKRDLSMQEVLSYFADRVASESNDVIRLLDQIVKDKQYINDDDEIYWGQYVILS